MYSLSGTESLVTPALLVFHAETQRNLETMIEIAGSPSRLRPHCKTHKMPAVASWWLELGVTRHKCATLAEAEMLADAGVPDILLAYPIVGANLNRVILFRQRYPQVRLIVLVDHPQPLKQLNDAFSKIDRTIEVLLDLETGLKRTGVPPGDRAIELYESIVTATHVQAAGLHWYDGHLHQSSFSERQAAVLAAWDSGEQLQVDLQARGLPVPTIVAGGTGSFPVYAQLTNPAIELSPGSCVFHDAGYGRQFPDLPFTPSALLLTRVISRPTPDRITLDLGYKACASDPPLEQRLVFPALPDSNIVLQNEEHLVLQTPQAERFAPGDELLAIPSHICPTSAMHKEAIVIRDGVPAERWSVTARDRQLEL